MDAFLLQMSVIRSIAVFLCGFYLKSCYAQVPFLGACPDVDVMPAFNISRVLFTVYVFFKYLLYFKYTIFITK